MSLSFPHCAIRAILFYCFIVSYASAEDPSHAETILKKMEMAYARVNDYQTNVEIRTYTPDGSFESQKFLYTFKKPKWIRLDMESPHSDMILVYPDKNGKVVVRPGGVARIFHFHLSPGNPLIMGASGRRMDQTEVGLLIKNISRSIADERRGPIDIGQNGTIRIRILSVNHFKKNITTLYQFFVDKELWLPVKVEELLPRGQLERSISCRHARINTGVPDSFFKVD